MVDRVHDQLDDPSVLKVIGNIKKSQHGPRRRIHWYEMGGSIIKSERSSGKESSSNQREVSEWWRTVAVECSMFAETPDNLELLLDNLIVAISKGMDKGNMIEWGGYQVTDEHVNQRGSHYVLSWSCKLPVYREQSDLVTIASVSTTCDITGTDDE